MNFQVNEVREFRMEKNILSVENNLESLYIEVSSKVQQNFFSQYGKTDYVFNGIEPFHQFDAEKTENFLTVKLLKECLVWNYQIT